MTKQRAPLEIRNVGLWEIIVTVNGQPVELEPSHTMLADQIEFRSGAVQVVARDERRIDLAPSDETLDAPVTNDEGGTGLEMAAAEAQLPQRPGEYPVSVWLPWYFTRGLWSIVTIPLFIIISLMTLWSVVGALLQAYGLVRVMHAVYGLLGVAAIVCGLWIPLAMPPAIWYSLLKNLPGVWIRQNGRFDRSKRIAITVAVLLFLPLAAAGCAFAIGRGIGWIADRDPCAAYAAGVTGSIMPTDCE